MLRTQPGAACPRVSLHGVPPRPAAPRYLSGLGDQPGVKRSARKRKSPLCKCGGLLPSLRLARFARQHDALIQLGCMVGETSILSAAGRAFLEMVPRVVFAEGWFGSFLLSEDVVRRPLRFGYGGRGRSLPGPGFGVTVDPNRLHALAADRPTELAL